MFKNVCTICEKVTDESGSGIKIIIDVVCDDCQSEMNNPEIHIKQKDLYEEIGVPENVEDWFQVFTNEPAPYCNRVIKLINNNTSDDTKGIFTSPLICVFIAVGSKGKGFSEDIEEISIKQYQRFGYYKGIPIYRDMYAKTNYITFN